MAGAPISWSGVSDAFFESGKLYFIEGGTLRSRTFDGQSFGSAVNEPSWTSWPSVTAATWHGGKLYYVESTGTSLKYRYFSLESGIVGSQTFTLSSGISWSNIAAMDFVDGDLYYAKTNGNLWAIEVDGAGIPVNGTQRLVSGPAVGDGQNWNDPSLFFITLDNLGPSVTLTAPVAGATVGGIVNVSATATDDQGVTQVAFAVDGTSIGVDTNGTNGWSVTWDTTTHPGGPATVSATATDTANNTASDQVAVTVDNASPGTVLMVVADPNALIAGETAVRNRLTNAGYTVTVVDDGAVTAAQANGTAFVFISSNVNATTVGTKLRDVVQPVWTAKPYLFDDMRMTGTGAEVDYGNVSSASIVITAPAHPLAAGLSGTVAVTTANHTKSSGSPARVPTRWPPPRAG